MTVTDYDHGNYDHGTDYAYHHWSEYIAVITPLLDFSLFFAEKLPANFEDYEDQASAEAERFPWKRKGLSEEERFPWKKRAQTAKGAEGEEDTVGCSCEFVVVL